ncbi:MAG: hypothetical protein R3C18_17430 [Planctomycetaceae bacterium]
MVRKVSEIIESVETLDAAHPRTSGRGIEKTGRSGRCWIRDSRNWGGLGPTTVRSAIETGGVAYEQ